MDYDNERPAKRVCLEKISILEIQSVSPIRQGIPDQNFKYSIQNFLLNHECQSERPPCSVSSPDNERSTCLQNEGMEATRTSSADLDSISSQESGCLAESADLVCFGSITSLSVSMVDKLSNRVKLQINDVGQLFQPDQTFCGSLAKRDIKLLDLLSKEGIIYDILWIPASKTATGQLGTLWLTIYGARELASDLGDTLQEAEVYLQDQIHAERNTLYWNPHKFQNIEGLYTTSLTCNAVESYPEVGRFKAIDVLKDFTSEDNLLETEGSASLRTSLKSHQMRGLTFMLRREQGWQLDIKNGDVWTMTVDEDGNTAYLNNVDDSQHYERPPSFCGGIIADDMGLGKTLSMIALIAHDTLLYPKPRQIQRTTLVVVPPSLLSNWETELRERTSPGHLSWFLYHGPSRATRSYSFSDFDVILTTYSTFAREWISKGGKTSIFTHHWHRVILDEAQVIKNNRAATAQAACALNANCRWVVTATPIQNRLSELFSLLQFLRLYPYNEHNSLTWESDNPELAIKRLKTLLGFIMLRRHKDILHLPERTDTVIPIGFDGQDKAKYDRAKRATIQYLDDIISSETGGGGYMNAISKINALRMVCNLGCSTDSRDTTLGAATSESTSEASLDREDIGAALEFVDQPLDQDDMTESTSTCTMCGVLILTSPSPGPEDHLPQRTASMEPAELMISKGSTQCRSCFSDSIGVLESSHEGPPMLELESQQSCNGKLQGEWTPSRVFSTKVKALVSDLTSQRQAKKSIVFSFWKSTLDLASSALTQAGFTCLQVDGKVPANQRGTILQRFSESEVEAVLLMSLSCGGVGLNLTAASRAYLMEPQWNPAIEEQALARVYRLGQTRPVVTVRFFVNETIEEYVRQVQEAKQELVDMLLSKNSAERHSKITELREVLS
ncbi:SNF2 family N-terminal domain-containing protein [Diaporthe sp. PMI_573]|nr:SNF2 family N-terminal domain-containing protein [Diaporthaceae sp. PMI_573]